MNTNEHESEFKMAAIMERVIGCAMKVHNTLGAGFLEKVYENALPHELRKTGFHVEQQKPIPVRYDGVLVGDYIADLVVEGKVLLELKAVSGFSGEHTAVCLNYLRAAGTPVCLLINFGKPRLDWKRLVGEAYQHSGEVL